MKKQPDDNIINILDIIPNIDRKLKEISNKVDLILLDIRKDKHRGNFNSEVKNNYNKKLILLLEKVGDYSQPAFNVRCLLENNYINRYKNDSKKGSELFLNHYSSIHKPYDTVKNKIWKLLNLTQNNE